MVVEGRVHSFLRGYASSPYAYLPIIALILIIDVWMIASNSRWMDVDHYWYNIDDLFSHGMMPYRDYVFEYPPFSLAVFLIPRLFSFDLGSFRYSFAFFSSLAYVISAWLVMDMTKDNRKMFPLMVGILLIVPIVDQLFIMTRNDTFAMLFVVLSLWCYRKGYTRTAYVMVALAAMIKIYPALLIVGYVIYDIAKRDNTTAFRGLMVCGLTCLLMELPFLIIDPGSAFNYLTYHTGRPIQIESVTATLMYVAYAFGLTSLHYDSTSGSENIVGELPDILSPYVNAIMVAAIILLIVWLVSRIRYSRPMDGDGRMRLLYMVLPALTLMFIVLSKVYSAQYMLWILMLMPMLIWSESDERTQISLFVMTTMFGLASMIAAANYNGSDFLTARFIILEAVKNILTVALLVMDIRIINNKLGKRPEASEDKPIPLTE